MIATLYNYSRYGQKSSNREQFYKGSPRNYIEVTDEVYCESNLFQLYSFEVGMHSAVVLAWTVA